MSVRELTQQIMADAPSTKRLRLGYVCFALSFALWGLVFAVPLIIDDNQSRLILAGSIYAVSYLFFFIASWALGPTVMKSLKGKLTQWFRRPKP